MKPIQMEKVVINANAINEVEKCIELFGEKYMINAFKFNKINGQKFESQQDFAGFEYLDTLSLTQFFGIVNKNYISEQSFEDTLSFKYMIYNSEISFNDENVEFINRKKGFVKVCKLLQKYNVNLEFLPESNIQNKKVLIPQKLSDAIEAFIDAYSLEDLIYVYEKNKIQNKRISSGANHLYSNLVDLDDMDFNDFFKLVNGQYEIIEELYDSLEIMYLNYKKNNRSEIVYEKEGFIDAINIMNKYGYKLPSFS